MTWWIATQCPMHFNQSRRRSEPGGGVVELDRKWKWVQMESKAVDGRERERDPKPMHQVSGHHSPHPNTPSPPCKSFFFTRLWLASLSSHVVLLLDECWAWNKGLTKRNSHGGLHACMVWSWWPARGGGCHVRFSRGAAGKVDLGRRRQ